MISYASYNIATVAVADLCIFEVIVMIQKGKVSQSMHIYYQVRNKVFQIPRIKFSYSNLFLCTYKLYRILKISQFKFE